MPFPRTAFKTTAVLALPGLLWQAFEMYGLTLAGPQMLFFSVIHTMPVAIVLVLLAVPCTIVLLGQAVASYFFIRYRDRLGITQRAAVALAIFLSAHLIALLGYEVWSSSVLRVPICIGGFALFATAALYTVTALGNPYPPTSDVA